MEIVSIIVPIYNSEKFISNSLNSLTEQSYRNIEIILIDDGSNDNSLAICNGYAKRDKRIKVFSQQNKGAAAARNLGLSKANGKYIMFCDSDDMVSKFWVEHLLSKIQKNAKCMPICLYCNDINVLGNYVINSCTKNKTSFLKNEYWYLNQVGLSGYLWNTIFCKEYIDKNNIRFREQKNKADYNEDLLFIFNYLEEIQKFEVISFYDYAYLTREDSFSRTYSPFYYEKYSEKYLLWMIYAKKNDDLQDSASIATFYLYHFLISLHNQVTENNYKKFKDIIYSDIICECLKFADTSKENNREIECIKKKRALLLWFYLRLAKIKNINFDKHIIERSK